MRIRYLLLLFLILLKSQAFAVSLNSFGSNGSAAVENSEDTRHVSVDADGDGSIDVVASSDRYLDIIMSPKADGTSELEITEDKDGHILRAKANVKDGVAVLSSVSKEEKPLAKSSAIDIGSSNSCSQKNILEKLIESSEEISGRQIQSQLVDVFDSSCSEVLPEKSKAHIERTMAKFFSNSSLVSCIGDEKSFSEAKKIAFLAKRKSYVDHLADRTKGLIKCSRKASELEVTQKDNSIVLDFVDEKELKKTARIRDGLFISMLESLGIKGDDAKTVFKSCLESKEVYISQASAWASQIQVEKNAKKDGTAGMKKVMSQSEVAAINTKLAETKITLPSAEESSPRALAQVAETQGSAAASAVARNQSSSLLGAANTIMGAISTPASAASTSSSTSSSSASRSPAGTLSKSVVGTRVPGAKAARGVGADEEIVEEIDLTANQQATRARAAINQQRSRQNSQNSRRGPASESSPVGESSVPEIAGAGSGGGTVGSSGGGSGFSGGGSASASGGARAAATNRRTASSGSNTQNASREEIITFFGGADYTMARQKLREPTFVKTLEENKITVLDLSGNSYGAKRGEIIFLDQGDRFVRQK